LGILIISYVWRKNEKDSDATVAAFGCALGVGFDRRRSASSGRCVAGGGCLCPCRRRRSCGEGDGEPVCESVAERWFAESFDHLAGKFDWFAGKPDGVAGRFDRRP